MKQLLADLKADGDDERQVLSRLTVRHDFTYIALQVTALTELCNFLSMATEESLIAFRY